MVKKYEFVIKEYRIHNESYDPNNFGNLKYNEQEWLKYYQHKINLKKRSKEELDKIAKKILEIRRDNFVSNIFERNYTYFKRRYF